MSPDPVKVAAIAALKPPRNRAELRSLLGLANFV
jgi:hypothetical protein